MDFMDVLDQFKQSARLFELKQFWCVLPLRFFPRTTAARTIVQRGFPP